MGRRVVGGYLILFLVVWGAQFAFGMWMNSRGFLWNDALSRAANALYVLHSADPKLAAIGFVWMPLPSLVELLWVVLYPVWPAIVASGLVSSLTTALAGGATAALLLYTARTLRLPEWLGWVFALLVATNPMVFLYAGNGLSEGVAAPFLTGTVCFLVLFWASGRRRYVTAAALALALGFASLYEAVPYGAALFAALVLGVLRGTDEMRVATVRGRRWFAASVGALLMVPSLCIAALWVGANAVIMDDPLFFMRGQYSNAAITASTGTGLESAEGNFLGTLAFVATRTVPFLIPGGFLLLIRVLDGRFWRMSTLSLALLLLSVPLGIIAPLVHAGTSYGWLRYFMYPLFVAAGWGLYEIAVSRRRDLAVRLLLAGWLVAAPVVLWAMVTPALGREEHLETRGFLTGEDAEQIGFDTATGSLERYDPAARYLEGLPDDGRIVVDASGWAVGSQTSPDLLKRLVLSHDSQFGAAVSAPRTQGVSYFLVPDPSKTPTDRVVQRWPSLWSGEEPGFELIKSFPKTPPGWRLYEVAEK